MLPSSSSVPALKLQRKCKEYGENVNENEMLSKLMQHNPVLFPKSNKKKRFKIGNLINALLKQLA